MIRKRGFARGTAVLTAAALVTVVLSGCTGAGGPGSSGISKETTPSGEKIALKLDSAAAETKTITADAGAAFATSSGESTAAVLIMPGTFADGTSVTFTPLEDPGDKALSPGFDITADGGAQPLLPVFVVLETTAEIPDAAGIVAYGDEGDDGAVLQTQVSSDGDTNYLVAQVTHFTKFRFESDLPPVSRPKDANDAYQRGFKQWTVKVNDSQKIDDGLWLGKQVFEMDVQSPAGDIFGPYNGQGSYQINADISGTPALSGHMEGSWGGAVNFSKCDVKKWSMSYQPTLGGDSIKPGLGFWLLAEGTFMGKEITPISIDVQGLGGLGTKAAYPVQPAEAPIELFISEGGATVTMNGVRYHGFVIGTLAEEPPQ